MKVISRTELIMFNDFAPAYFEYMSKTLFHDLPTSLCKVDNTIFRFDDHSQQFLDTWSLSSWV